MRFGSASDRAIQKVDQAVGRADGVEGVGDDLRAVLDSDRQERLGEERSVDRSIRQRGKHVGEGDELDLHVVLRDAAPLEPLEDAEVRDGVWPVDQDRLADEVAGTRDRLAAGGDERGRRVLRLVERPGGDDLDRRAPRLEQRRPRRRACRRTGPLRTAVPPRSPADRCAAPSPRRFPARGTCRGAWRRSRARRARRAGTRP